MPIERRLHADGGVPRALQVQAVPVTGVGGVVLQEFGQVAWKTVSRWPEARDPRPGSEWAAPGPGGGAGPPSRKTWPRTRDTRLGLEQGSGSWWHCAHLGGTPWSAMACQQARSAQGQGVCKQGKLRAGAPRTGGCLSAGDSGARVHRLGRAPTPHSEGVPVYVRDPPWACLGPGKGAGRAPSPR